MTREHDADPRRRVIGAAPAPRSTSGSTGLGRPRRDRRRLLAPVLRTSSWRRGYAHTLREIAQQPVTWIETASRWPRTWRCSTPSSRRRGVRRARAPSSSPARAARVYAGECLALPLQQALRRARAPRCRRACILTHPDSSLPPAGPVPRRVSLARSGNSPESAAVARLAARESRPQAGISSSPATATGRSPPRYRERPARAHRGPRREDQRPEPGHDEQLHEHGAGGRAPRRRPATPEATSAGASPRLARRRRVLLQRSARRAGRAWPGAASAPPSTWAAAAGCGSAREARLKMLEMNGGPRLDPRRVLPRPAARPHVGAARRTPWSWPSSPPTPMVRAYEARPARELDRKELGARKVVVGAAVPPDLAARREDVSCDCAAAGRCRDEDLALLDVLVGQLLAFFRCLVAGLRPDSPSAGGVINRVVASFAIHRRANRDRGRPRP